MRRLALFVGVLCLAGMAACDAPTPTTNATPNGPARTSVAPPASRVCVGECAAILRGAIEWVAKTRSVAPARILLDTIESGRSSYRGVRVLPASLLANVTALSGVGGSGSDDKMAECFGSPFRAAPESCRSLRDKIMVTVYAPILSDDNAGVATMTLVQSWNTPEQARVPGFWVRAGYRLKLERVGGGWRVVDAERTFQS